MKVNDSAAFTISQGGNIGIGTPTPSNKLSVSGSIDVTTDLRIGTTSISSGSEIQILKSKGSGGYVQSLAQNTHAAGGTGWAVQNNLSKYMWFEILGSSYSTGFTSEVPNAAVLLAGGTNLSIVTHDAYPIQFWTSETERMRIDSAGKVGIGVSSPGYALDVSGSLHITGTPYRDSGDIVWTVPSDARLKNVVGVYDRGLADILEINTVRYHYKPGNPRKISSESEFTGVLAQNVQAHIPEAVKTDDSGYLSLNTTPIFWAMLNSTKELYVKILGIDQKLQSELDQKDREIQELKSYICMKDPQAPFCK